MAKATNVAIAIAGMATLFVATQASAAEPFNGPYVGVEAGRKFGRSADFARSAGESAFDPRLVAGFRIWF